jgi:hypothetical protein
MMCAEFLAPTGQRAGLRHIGDLQRDHTEHVDDQHVGRPGCVGGIESGVGQQFEEPFKSAFSSQAQRHLRTDADRASSRAGSAPVRWQSGDPELAHLAVEGVATDTERPSRPSAVAACRSQSVGHRLPLG